MSVVYFIRSGEDGPIKIGHATDVSKRLTMLQTGSATALRLLGTIPGGRETEQALHRDLAKDRISGEWFSATPAVLDAAAKATPFDGVAGRPGRKAAAIGTPLACYMQAHGHSNISFAAKVGTSPAAINKIRYGQRRPSLPLAVKIVEATDGKLTAADLLPA